jgi:hypothetical protein
VVAVDQDEPWPDSHEGTARRFLLLRKGRSVPGEFDDGTQKRCGNGIGRKDQDGVTAHVTVVARGCIASGWK